MKRRNLIFGLLVVATIGGAHAQQSKKAHRIAVIDPSHPIDESGESPMLVRHSILR
jgi:hypothetical protein